MGNAACLGRIDMTARVSDMSPQKTQRIAGALCLTMLGLIPELAL
jgi:hypothetical protein